MAFEFPLDYDITQILIEVNSSLFMYPFMGRNIAPFQRCKHNQCCQIHNQHLFCNKKNTNLKKRRGFKKKQIKLISQPNL